MHDNHQNNLTHKMIQEIQLKMLEEINRICIKYNIVYHLYAGTLLGAVRHKGFIPWDDDIDIAMTRQNYNKFIEVSRKEINNSFYLDIPNYEGRLHICKIRMNNTFLYEYATLNLKNRHHGIYVDIFPLDNSKPNTLKGKIQEIQLSILFRLKVYMYLNKLKYKTSKFKTLIRRVLFIILFPLRIIYTKKRIFNRIEKVSKKFNKKETGYVCELSHGMSKGKYERNSYALDDIKDTVYLMFEGKKYPAPKSYHKILTQHFGDYMVLPPKEKRTPSHIHLVSFDGKTFYD